MGALVGTRADILCELFNDEGAETASYQARSEVHFRLNPTSHLWVCEDGADIGWQGICVPGLIVFSRTIPEGPHADAQSVFAQLLRERRGAWYTCLEEVIDAGSEDGIKLI